MKVAAWGAAILLSGALVACGAPRDDGNEDAGAGKAPRLVAVGPEAAGDTVSLRVGDRLVIEWAKASGDHRLALMRHPSYSLKLVGRRVAQRLRLEATAPGRGALVVARVMGPDVFGCPADKGCPASGSERMELPRAAVLEFTVVVS